MSFTKQIQKGAGKKRGRKARYHEMADGTPVAGLARRKDGRWRIVATGETFVEPNEKLAVQRFMAWKARQGGGKIYIDHETVAPTVSAKDSITARKAKRREITFTPVPGTFGQVTIGESIPEEAIWPWLQKLLIERPEYVAEKVGIPEIARLADLPRRGPSPTLAEVGRLYFEHAKISPNWMSKAKAFWDEFVDSVGVTKLREVEQEHVVNYSDLVRENAASPSYARQRFGAIKAIINYPTKRGRWAEDAKRALALCAVLVPPKKPATDPKPLAPAEFAKLVEKADDQMKALLLLALNAAMYGAEVAVLNWSDLDLDKGTLCTDRNKTKVVRVATLWPRTVEALRKLPRRGDAIFRTEAGTQADYLCVYRQFKICRTAAELEGVQFSQIRDSAYTAAVEAGVDLNVCKLLAGHSTGISDHYVKRRPQMVADACAAIEQAYFG